MDEFELLRITISLLIGIAVLIIVSSSVSVATGMYKLKRDIRQQGVEPKLFSRMMKPWIDFDTR